MLFVIVRKRGVSCKDAIAYVTIIRIIYNRLLLAAGIKEIKYLEDYKNDELVEVFTNQLNVSVLKNQIIILIIYINVRD